MFVSTQPQVTAIAIVSSSMYLKVKLKLLVKSLFQQFLFQHNLIMTAIANASPSMYLKVKLKRLVESSFQTFLFQHNLI